MSIGNAFSSIASLVRVRSGLILGPDKQYLVENRLAPIIRREKLGSLDALADRIRLCSGGELEREVVEAMTTNESLFFRDEKPFTHVRQHALPALHKNRAPGETLRIWSAAASSGQEAYSLAISVSECRNVLCNRVVRVLGTDIAREQLSRARIGEYNKFETQRGLSKELLTKYFSPTETGWRISDKIKTGVEFREANLIDDKLSLGQFDIVFCRNVLIYFDVQTKTKVLNLLAKQMRPDGYLYLGSAETTLGISTLFKPLAGERGVYSLAS